MTRDILKNAVNLCKIRNDGREYITLYYFSVSDAHERLLHRGNQIVCFESDEQAMEFCDKNRLLLQEKIIYLDYDEEITRDIMAVSVVRKWNILDSMRTVFGIKITEYCQCHTIHVYIHCFPVTNKHCFDKCIVVCI